MPFDLFCSMTLTAALTVWSPGPNNILLLTTASQYGFRKNLKFMSGIWTGSMLLMTLSGFLCQTLSRLMPGIWSVMKYAGAAYLCFLAYKTWRRLPPKEGRAEREPSYKAGVFLQLINMKIIFYGLTMFTSFILPCVSSSPAILLFAFYLMVMGAIGNLIWAFAGNILKRFYQNHYRGMNVVMALLLLWSAAQVAGH